jgi:hypothetical protein
MLTPPSKSMPGLTCDRGETESHWCHQQQVLGWISPTVIAAHTPLGAIVHKPVDEYRRFAKHAVSVNHPKGVR